MSKAKLQENNSELQAILETVQGLPDAAVKGVVTASSGVLTIPDLVGKNNFYVFCVGTWSFGSASICYLIKRENGGGVSVYEQDASKCKIKAADVRNGASAVANFNTSTGELTMGNTNAFTLAATSYFYCAW